MNSASESPVRSLFNVIPHMRPDFPRGLIVAVNPARTAEGFVESRIVNSIPELPYTLTLCDEVEFNSYEERVREAMRKITHDAFDRAFVQPAREALGYTVPVSQTGRVTVPEVDPGEVYITYRAPRPDRAALPDSIYRTFSNSGFASMTDWCNNRLARGLNAFP